MTLESIETIDPPCWYDTGSVTIDFTASYEAPGFSDFGSVTIAFDEDNDDNYDPSVDVNIVQVVPIPNASSLSDLTVSVSSLDPGDYVFLIEDNGSNTNSCLLTGDFEIVGVVEPDPDIFFTALDAACFEASGSAYVSDDPIDMGGTPIIGGATNYDVFWYYYDENGSLNDLPDDFVDPSSLIATSLYADVSPYSGDYMVLIIDGNDCEFYHNFTIEQPDYPLDPGPSWLNVDCNSECTSEITVQPTGPGFGSNFYTIQIEDLTTNVTYNETLTIGVEDTYVLDNLCAGDYILTVGDGICPPVVENITITEPDPIVWNIVTEPLACAGDWIDFTASGFTDGEFYVDQGGTQPADLLWFIFDETNPDCGDTPTNQWIPDVGWANFNNYGGQWNDISNLYPGCYVLLSIDSEGCETTHHYQIDETPALTVDLNTVDSEFWVDPELWVYCSGDDSGRIAFNTYYEYQNGDIEPATDYITYFWYIDNAPVGVLDPNDDYLPQYNDFNDVAGLFAGDYIISVNNENNCGPIDMPVSILEPDLVDANPVSSDYNGYGITCSGLADGTIELNATGGLLTNPGYGYIYQWEDSSGNPIGISTIPGEPTLADLDLDGDFDDLINLPAGEYTYIVYVDLVAAGVCLDLDNDGICDDISLTCLDSGNIEITDPGVLDFVATPDHVTCNGANNGEIEVEIIGGSGNYTYAWSNINNLAFSGVFGPTSSNVYTISNLGPGDYVITVNNDNNCGPIDNILNPIEVQEPPPFEADNVSTGIVLTPTNCGAGLGNDASGVIEVDYADVYTQLAAGVNSGTAPYQVQYIEDSNGNQITPNSDDGTYMTFSNLQEDIYTLIIQDGEGCLIEIPTPITTLNPFPLDLDFLIEPDNCGSNGSILISSFSTIDWNNDGVIEPGVSPYTITLEPAGGGVIYSLSNITPAADNDPAWNPNDFGFADPNVDGDGYPNEADGDIDGDDIPNGVDPSPYGLEPVFDGSGNGFHQSLSAGDYILSVIDDNGCIGGPFTITVPGPESFDFDIIAGGCYWETENTCETASNDGQIIINPNTLSIATLYPYYIYIDGELHNNTPVGDWGYNPVADEFDSYIIDGLEAGTTYSISIEDANGCGYPNNGYYYEIPFNSNLNVEIVGFCPECQEASNGGFGYTFLTIEDEVVTGFTPDVTIQEVGPSDNSSISILYTEDSVEDCLPDPHNLNTVLENDALEQDYYFIDQDWLSNVPDPNALVGYHEDYLADLEMSTDHLVGGFSYGTYNITIIDPDNGCQFTQEIDISDENCRSEFGSQQWNNCLFIPSVFTPNADGINDLWDIYNIELYEPGVNIKVFNRWGQIVYQNDDNEYSNNLWDGVNTKGKDVEIATYYYVVEVDVDSEQKKYTGYVVVKR